MKNTLIITSLCLGLLAGAAEAKSCKNKPLRANGNTVHPTALIVSSSQARNFARQAWDNRCSRRFGGTWCDRAMATGARFICNRVPNGVGGLKHVCEYEATPCRND